ncbi:hypothetical protein ASD50_19310 [Mesorhizobium sp. Root552]|jgi:hypothetical protein|uniref:DUF4160 domain-containing protein n=1 Tax=Mesorhizobium sp. Root552 TaxID=1736555 RepID=UPI0006F56849|nr:DUF4160 domain-containing protein [Mesorhizobium sp. Root552]KQZ28635.1 hypothetical protein ASD50_19310 [Mesorhizobium sp. Root552]
MPTIVTIGKIKIQIYADDHNPPHFHVLSGDDEALVSIQDLQIFRGQLRRRDFDTAIEWARAHREELEHEWNRLNA